MYSSFYNAITTLTPLDKKDKIQRLAKLMEETGELAEAVLSETNAPGCEYKTFGKHDVLEECCDVLIVTASILAQYDFDPDNINIMLKRKLKKWQKVCTGTSVLPLWNDDE